MKTVRLFDIDSHLSSFSASVLSCERSETGYDVILDKTAFFPEGGGQAADTGIISDSKVLDVHEIDGVIHHYCLSPVELGEVYCSIDWTLRFSRMQNHSGEHVFSGIINRLTGFENVGFHMGDEYMTIDFSGEIDKETLKNAELLANEAIYANGKIICTYPAANELKNINYRSKLDLTDNVRIVDIEGVDVCACCAPHVSNTGEIGIIKVLGDMRHRGGTRVFLACGKLALNDYITIKDEAAVIGELLSVKHNEISDAVIKLNTDYLSSKSALINEKKKYAKLLSKSAEMIDGDAFVFDSGLSMDDLREVVNNCLNNSVRFSAAFSGDDIEGYTYVIGSRNIALNAISKQLNAQLNGRGGGRPDMIQGTFKASKTEIIEALYSIDK